MVDRVVGYYNNMEILFQRLSETIYQAALPPIQGGSVVLELYAVDMAGNVGTRKESIVLIDFHNLTVRVLQTNLEAHQQEQSQYESKPFCSDYKLRVIEGGCCA